jgi:hypothetical protein
LGPPSAPNPWPIPWPSRPFRPPES